MFPTKKELAKTSANSVDLSKIYYVKYSNDIDPYEAAKQMMESSLVEYAEPKFVRTTCYSVNDYYYVNGNQYAINKIQANLAWDICKGSKDVIIGIVDTGVEWMHPDLSPNIWINPDEIADNGIDDDHNGYIDDIRGWDLGGFGNGSKPTPDNNPDEDGKDHGTHVAGIASAATDNTIGVSGVAYNCKLMCIKTSINSQRNERSALTLLALCNIKKNDDWSDAKQTSMSVVGNKNNPKYPGIMRFIRQNYKIDYAENSRETFRRQTLHQFYQAYIVDHNPENKSLPTNSKDNHYRITDDAIKVIRSFNSKKWDHELNIFLEKNGSLKEKYLKVRKTTKNKIKLPNGLNLALSPGQHNKLQAAIIEHFIPCFAPKCEILYLGDTANKNLYHNEKRMNELSIPYTQHGKLPDIILFEKKKNWLYLIEAVTSHGPFSPKRIIEIEKLLKKCKAGKIFISAFPNIKTFNKFSNDIAWETEVWIAEKDLYSHMIHFNGDRFIGPR